MPRIAAPTVAAHHAERRAALLAAGAELLASGGVAAVTPAAVGARAGLARSSVYQYFDSTSALLAAIYEHAFTASAAALEQATAAHTDPRARIEAYVAAAFAVATNAEHHAVAAMDQGDLPPEVWRRLDSLHGEQLAPLVAALGELGVTDPELSARLTLGLLSTAAREVMRGADSERVFAVLMQAVSSGIASSPTTAPQRAWESHPQHKG